MTHATLEAVTSSLAGAFLLTTMGAVALLTVSQLAAIVARPRR